MMSIYSTSNCLLYELHQNLLNIIIYKFPQIQFGMSLLVSAVILQNTKQSECQQITELVKILIHTYNTIISTVASHLSGQMFGNQFTSITESYSRILKFSYMDGRIGNGSVRISEAPLYIFISKCSLYIWQPMRHKGQNS